MSSSQLGPGEELCSRSQVFLQIVNSWGHGQAREEAGCTLVAVPRKADLSRGKEVLELELHEST